MIATVAATLYVHVSCRHACSWEYPYFWAISTRPRRPGFDASHLTGESTAVVPAKAVESASVTDPESAPASPTNGESKDGEKHTDVAGVHVDVLANRLLHTPEFHNDVTAGELHTYTDR